MGLWKKAAGPVVSVVAAAVAFSAFHLSIFRALPTLALGCLLGAVAYRARSTWCSALAHACNNGIAVGLGLLGAATVDPGWWSVPLAGAAIFAASRVGGAARG